MDDAHEYGRTTPMLAVEAFFLCALYRSIIFMQESLL